MMGKFKITPSIEEDVRRIAVQAFGTSGVDCHIPHSVPGTAVAPAEQLKPEN
jgi:hypothetical protein